MNSATSKSGKSAEAKSAAPKNPKASAQKSSNGKMQKTGKNTGTATHTDDGMLKEFFIDELKDIYWAEKHLLKVLPKMNKAATTQELKDCFTDHLEVTKTHVARLDEVFGMLGKKAQAKKCEAMAGITKEGEGIIEDTDEGTSTRDVGLILAAQKVEHYEISTYGGLRQLAATLGLKDVEALLQQTLDEEKEADETLSKIAESSVNYEAAQEMA